MVGKDYIDIHSLTMDELAGVVNLYPWFGAARKDLCDRMAKAGGETWGVGQFGDQALYIADRTKISSILRKETDCTDADVQEILKMLITKDEPRREAEGDKAVRVVGGDYFSQAQYDKVRSGDDNIFSRFASRAGKDSSTEENSTMDIADRFCTETLAEIFAEQGCMEEARRIYSRLILDNPEKSAYFAALIDKLK